MAVASGYKQVEFGMIPEDWICVAVTQIAAPVRNAIVGGPFGSDLVSKDYAENGVPVIRGQNMGNKYVGGSFVFVTAAKAKKLEANLAAPFDLIFTQRGTLGQVSIIPEVPFSRYLVSQSQMKVSLNHKIAHATFYYYVFTSWNYKRILDQSTIQTGVPHVNLGILKAWPVPRPSLKEQEAIAEALSDADAYIESLEQLLAKKRDMQQGVTQKLLTGECSITSRQVQRDFVSTEVGEIPNTWQAIPLGRLFDFSGGVSASRNDLSDEGNLYLHYGDIHLSNKRHISVTAEADSLPKLQCALNKVPTRSLLKDGDVVFVDASEDLQGVSKCVVIENETNVPFISGLHTVVAKRRDKLLNKRFLRHAFDAASIKRQFEFYAAGTKVLSVNKSNLHKIILAVPPPQEQADIADILIDMDSELWELQAKLSKALDVKQGMMQQLITGKHRFV